MLQKLIEMIDLLDDSEIDEIYKNLFNERIFLLNYISSYIEGRNCSLNAIIRVHQIYCYLEEKNE